MSLIFLLFGMILCLLCDAKKDKKDKEIYLFTILGAETEGSLWKLRELVGVRNKF